MKHQYVHALAYPSSTVLHAPETIECDYRSKVKDPLINCGQEDFSTPRGMRIAQTVIRYSS
ncbi:hypothetical protein [Bartonella rattimassiliensis]|uniref:hypothetical protein n=1 Tax=Bartonella rattimassiliensis TaxID=270250 RepID=UPI0012DC2B07|nr:hypothetical protein [Bartonella rattimassiliensis]